MSKKILMAGIIIILIIIVILLVMLFLLNRNGNEEQIMKNDDTASESQTVEEVINQYYEYMKNKNFKSASELFDENDFYNVLGETQDTKSIEEILEMSYNDYEEFYEYSIENVRQINGIEDFKNSTNIDITDEEYQKIFGNYDLYLMKIAINDENAEATIDVYIFNKDNKLVNTIRIMSSYATGGMIGQTKDAKRSTDKIEIQEKLMMAVNSIVYAIHDNPSLIFEEYCNKENLQKEIGNATINEFNWENDMGKGTITDEEGTTYNFTIDSNYKVEVSDTID